MIHPNPVSPPTLVEQPEAARPSGPEGHAPQEEEEVDLSNAQTEKVIEGVEQAERALVKPLHTPPSMTASERKTHNLTHQPPHRGCPICAANRTPNLIHGPNHEHERTIPLLVGDYCFLRSILDKPLLPCLVMRFTHTEFVWHAPFLARAQSPCWWPGSPVLSKMGLVHFA